MSLGQAVVDLVADTTQFERSAKDGIRGALGSAAKTATKAVVGLAAGVAGVGSAVAGIALKGGISRALNIEDAQAKLRGLGHDTQTIETIMDSALDSVRGTAFGLDAAAGAAASAVAAGIPPGEELTRVLGLTADAATIMGRSFGDSGAIINKILASNRVSMEEINQLHDAGLPILSMLADQYGVTAQEMREMVSDGVVSSESFLLALEGNIAGAALESGSTVRGAFANMGAAMSRWGEVVVKPLLPLVKNVFGGLTEVWDRATAAMKPLMEQFTQSETFAKLEAASKNIPGIFDSIAEKVGKAGGVIQAVTGYFTGLFDAMRSDGIVDTLMSEFGDFAPGIADAIADAFPKLLAAGQRLFDRFVAWLTTGGLAQIVQGILAGRQRLFEAALQLFPVLLDAIVTTLPQLINFIGTTLLPGIIAAIVNALPLLLETALTLFSQLVDALVEIVPLLLETIATVLLPQLLLAIIELVPELLLAALELFQTLIDAVVEILPQLIRTLLVVVLPQLITTIVKMLPQLLTAAIQAFMALVTGVLEVLPEIVSILLTEVLPTLVTTIISMVPELLAAAITLFTELVTGVAQIIPDLLGAVASMGLDLVNAVLGLGGALYDAGKNILNQLWDGIKEVGGKAVQWVKDNVVEKIKNLWPFSPAKEGPFKGSGSPLHAGRNIINQLAEGMAQAAPNALRAARGVVDGIQFGGPAMALAGGGAPGGFSPILVRDISVKIEISGDAPRSKIEGDARAAAQVVIEELSQARVVR